MAGPEQKKPGWARPPEIPGQPTATTPAGSEFMADGWRVFKIMAEFVNGFETMAGVGPAVSVFGSTRVRESDPEYRLAETMGRLLAEAGFGVITGGGPGVMEAANRGAQSVGGESIGFNIKLPNQQDPNPYIDPDKMVTFQYFFVRKVMFLKYSQSFIVLPGGFGTLDEFTEAINLIETRKSQKFPVIMMDSEYWGDLYRWIRKRTLEEKRFISESDMDFIYLEDDPLKVIEIIQGYYPEGYSVNF
ncbi:MAG: TIGR00730 family Rossman fold protein [Chlorobiaceae bacterium]|nr:TIGR00730 family Rossman fold protein [Chlorobiaceae bacterium]